MKTEYAAFVVHVDGSVRLFAPAGTKIVCSLEEAVIAKLCSYRDIFPNWNFLYCRIIH